MKIRVKNVWAVAGAATAVFCAPLLAQQPVSIELPPGMAPPPVAGTASSFVLGGQVKLGLNQTSMGGGTATNRLNDSTTYIYFDGKEPLDNGMQAFFRMEWSFHADTGEPNVPRNVYLGIGNDQVGRLQLGRQSVYFSHHWLINDPHGAFDAAPQAANSLNVLGSINGAHFAGTFMNNTIRYQLPYWHGLGGLVSYSTDAEAPNAARNHTWYVAPAYTNGGFKAAWLHMQRNNQGPLPASQTVGQLDQTADRLALGYTWGGLGVGVVADRNRVHDKASSNTQSRWAYAIPVNYQTGPYKWALTYGQAQPMHDAGARVAATGARMLSTSAQYALSRRTSVTASAVALRNQAQGRYNFWAGGLQPGPQLSQASAGSPVRMAYLGIMHTF